MEQLKVKLKCPKVLSTTGPRSITRAAPATPERKDLLPWPIKTRKRGSSSLALVTVESKEAPEPAPASDSINPPPPPPSGKEVIPTSSRSWSFTDLPPKKRILLAMRTRRVDHAFMCVTCGRVFEDYHALGGHKSQHRKRQLQGTPSSSSTDQTHLRLTAAQPQPQPQPHGKQTLALPWYDATATRFKVKM